MSNITWAVNNNDDINAVSHVLITTIKSVASDLGMVKTFHGTVGVGVNKAWYDAECRSAKRLVGGALELRMASNFHNSTIVFYQTLKKEYKKLLKLKKKAYDKSIIESLSCSRGSADFWSIINRFRPRNISLNNNNIDIKT